MYSWYIGRWCIHKFKGLQVCWYQRSQVSREGSWFRIQDIVVAFSWRDLGYRIRRSERHWEPRSWTGSACSTSRTCCRVWHERSMILAAESNASAHTNLQFGHMYSYLYIHSISDIHTHVPTHTYIHTYWLTCSVTYLHTYISAYLQFAYFNLHTYT